MAGYKTEDIRNVALVGHGGTGKTTLADLFLLKAGVSNRAGSVDDGSSVFDTDDDEKDRKSSITSSLGHITHNGKRINFIDTPGYPDFTGQVTGAVAAVETALCLISATAGIEVNTRRVFQLAGDAGIGRVIALNRCGGDNIDFEAVISDIQESFGMQCIPINVPDEVGPGFSSVQSTLGGDSEYSQNLTDCIVEADEELMEKYLETEELSNEEAAAGITAAIVAGTLIPIFCVSGRQDIGVSELLDGIASMFPSPTDIPRTAEDGSEVKADPSGPLAAQIFKTRIDPFVAKMNFVRVFSGTLKKDASVKNIATDKATKISTMNEVQGGELAPMTEVIAGDLAAIVKVDGLDVGNSLGDVEMPALSFPRSMVGWAVEPKTTADQQKISGAIQKLQDEDQTFTVVRDQQTKEMVIYGMSELHLQILIERMLKRDKVGVTTKTPRIPYREACTGSAEGSYRHKKQSGGSGQFAEVHF
ncbi:MAG: elongation factor G, partial [Planctomycetes bacterium]|nr:elongation factor G [Planctomycetota bacterium]